MEHEQEDDPYEAIQYGDFGTYIRHKKQKLQLQQEEIAALAASDTVQIFEGIIVYVNGYTDPPIHELRNMIVQRGGEFRQYLSKSSTTHIIASNLTQAKMREFRNYKVAKPEWITESVKANKLLSWHKFSTLRIPNSISKIEDAVIPQSSLELSSFSRRTNAGTELIEVDSECTEADSVGIPVDPHADFLGHRGEDHIPTSGMEPGVNRDSELGGTGDKEMSEAFSWEDDLFLDHLELDQFEFQATPPNDDIEGYHALQSDNHSEHHIDQDPRLKPGMPLEHSEHSKPNSDFTFDQYRQSGALPESNEVLADMDVSKPEIIPDIRHPTLVELSVPWNRLNSSVQPGFVEKFYQSSRLHYLSTWKIRLKELTTEIQKHRAPVTSSDKSRIIMHIDFDCFFASVATRNKAELQNKPIAVAHGSGGSTSNSEIASCNYLARGYGVKNGMQLLRARALCPDLEVVPYEFKEYEDISIEFYRILLSYADELQAVSVDEALVDVTSKCLPLWDPRSSFNPIDQKQDGVTLRMTPEMLADRVREEVFLATGCHASVGIAPNILLAKLATKRAKPHGQYIWPGAPGSEDTLQELRGPTPLSMDLNANNSLTPLGSDDGSQHTKLDSPAVKQSNTFKEFSVNDLPGVGYKTKQELQEKFSVRTLYELQQITKEELQRICGMKTGEMLYNSCRGIDETTLASDREKARQSVSAEISWGVRFENQDQVNVFLHDLAKEVSKRLQEIDRKGKSVVLKIMKRKEYVAGHWKHLGHGPVDQFARTGQLPMYTDDPDLIAKEARNLLQYFKFNVLDIRGNFSTHIVTSWDSMNQTTLSTAMFQRKGLSTLHSGVIGSGNIPTVDRTVELSKSTEQSDLSEQLEHAEEVFQGDVTLEIDSETFKELPTEIQEELSRHHRFVFVNQNNGVATSSSRKMEAQSNVHLGFEEDASLHRIKDDREQGVLTVQHTLLPWSQVDPAELVALSTPMIRHTLNDYAGQRRHNQALPPEIRAEIEQEYTNIMENHELIRKLARTDSRHTCDNIGSSLLQQPVLIDSQGSGRGRGKGVIRGSTRGRPRGRGRGRGKDFSHANAGGTTKDDVSEVPNTKNRDGQHTAPRKLNTDKETASGVPHVPNLDTEFLAALPPDIRAELEAAHKVETMKNRQRQATRVALTKDLPIAGLSVEHQKEKGAPLERSILLERPTLMGLRQVGEIRNMLGEWVDSTLLLGDVGATNVQGTSSSDEPDMKIYDEGPNPEDVRSFTEYIAKVIYMERDLDKVRLLLKFLRRKTEENKQKASPAHMNPRHMQVFVSWSEAVKSISASAEHLVMALYGGKFTIT
ncbi:deoxycytidyl transferase [Mortierella sp. AM989]|nr:deoxycytidyl transferase [Mortierella sp. AM989]